MDAATLREFFSYNDWARDRLMAQAVGLENEQLDRRFEMGEGSLRATLEHLYVAEWLWLERWRGRSPKKGEAPASFPTMRELWDAWKQTASERNRFVNGLSNDDLAKMVSYVNLAGNSYTFSLGHMLLHVCNHGTHHRAQAVNMLRHVGVPAPEMDFLVMHRSANG